MVDNCTTLRKKEVLKPGFEIAGCTVLSKFGLLSQVDWSYHMASTEGDHDSGSEGHEAKKKGTGPPLMKQ